MTAAAPAAWTLCLRLDAIAQFEVLASNYPPDYGISSGATMSLSLKSGTQKFHGEAYEFFRNDDLDANYFFNKYNGADAPVAKLRQNIFGGNLGGPLFIPHVYNTAKQKTFFFYNQEWRRIIQGSAPNVQPTIPDADRPVAGTDLPTLRPRMLLQSAEDHRACPERISGSDPAFAAKEAAAGLTYQRSTLPRPERYSRIAFRPNGVLYLRLR
jgi:hypothetical protein